MKKNKKKGKYIPKFFKDFLLERTRLVIQICHDLDLQSRCVYYPKDSDEYKDSLYCYTLMVDNELKKLSEV